jgi:hypothetical protein
MHRFIIPFVIALCSASPGFANEAVNRFQAASEAISEKLYKLSDAENPGVFKRLPDHEWDAAHRSAGTCVLVAIADQADAESMTQYIVALESVAVNTFGNTAALLEALNFQVSGVSSQSVQLISQACGLTELQAARLQVALQ